jgi:hypothetical protein
MPGLELCGQRDLMGRLSTRQSGVFRDPGTGVREPGVLGGPRLVGGGDHPELHRVQAAADSLQRGDRAGVVAGLQDHVRGEQHPVQDILDLGDAREHRVGAVGVEIEKFRHGSILSRTYVRVKTPNRIWTAKRTDRLHGPQPQRSSAATVSREEA